MEIKTSLDIVTKDYKSNKRWVSVNDIVKYIKKSQKHKLSNKAMDYLEILLTDKKKLVDKWCDAEPI